MQSKKSQAVSKPLKYKPKPALEDLKQLLRNNLADLRKEYRVSTLWLFGSYVRGEQHKHSDLDILVEFEEVPTLPKFISLERKLREITGIKVDLVSIRALKGEIGERILREKVAL
ncbi:MAG: nucleotidyltransferase family protein [Methanotrichaceae archaeon]|nr:nucleotidyltransferase family protein [Methanotrichaceae archaeon]